MEVKEFFEHHYFDIPLSYDNNDFYKGTESIFSQYLQDIDKITSDSDDLLINIKSDKARIKGICNGLLNTLRMYSIGKTFNAYKELEDTIESVKDQFDILCERDVKINLQTGISLYRAREMHDKNVTIMDLFHIPFDKIRQVGSQRFSIPGLPCLYLGSSTYVSWKEIGQPNINDVYFSRFELASSQTVEVLNLDFRKESIKVGIEYYKQDEYQVNHEGYKILLRALAVCWPIIMACSVIVKEKASLFFPEYIIPQLLLQYVVQKNGFDGIQYTSICEKSLTGNPIRLSNFVFPATYKGEGLYCEKLMTKFLMTQPVSWVLADLSNIHVCADMFGPPIYDPIELIPTQLINYEDTKFGRFENILQSCEAISLI